MLLVTITTEFASRLVHEPFARPSSWPGAVGVFQVVLKEAAQQRTGRAAPTSARRLKSLVQVPGQHEGNFHVTSALRFGHFLSSLSHLLRSFHACESTRVEVRAALCSTSFPHSLKSHFSSSRAPPLGGTQAWPSTCPGCRVLRARDELEKTVNRRSELQDGRSAGWLGTLAGYTASRRRRPPRSTLAVCSHEGIRRSLKQARQAGSRGR